MPPEPLSISLHVPAPLSFTLSLSLIPWFILLSSSHLSSDDKCFYPSPLVSQERRLSFVLLQSYVSFLFSPSRWDAHLQTAIPSFCPFNSPGQNMTTTWPKVHGHPNIAPIQSVLFEHLIPKPWAWICCYNSLHAFWFWNLASKICSHSATRTWVKLGTDVELRLEFGTPINPKGLHSSIEKTPPYLAVCRCIVVLKQEWVFPRLLPQSCTIEHCCLKCYCMQQH